MPTLSEYSAQLERCAQSSEEVRDFIESFSKVRLRYIARALTSTPADRTSRRAVRAARPGTLFAVAPDWGDPAKLMASGIDLNGVRDSASDPGEEWLHVDVALNPDCRASVEALLAQTCLSDKQRRALFPSLSKSQFTSADAREARRREVPRLNGWLAWSRTEGIDVKLFRDYQTHLRIHGASQNAGGDVGAVGGAIAIMDALEEVAPEIPLQLLGTLPPFRRRDPVSVDTFLRQCGISPDSKERPLKCVLLPNHRAVVFASDPDVAIIQSLTEPFQTPQEAWSAYAEVRVDAARRSQRLVEFAVGEIKAATDASNLHERLALSTRENRSERQTDRFLMMAILTRDFLTGSGGESGRRNRRAPMQSRDMARMGDVFNLHHAWGWDGGRVRHPEHWAWLKRRVKDWCGL